jgi:hypothetical protein
MQKADRARILQRIRARSAYSFFSTGPRVKAVAVRPVCRLPQIMILFSARKATAGAVERAVGFLIEAVMRSTDN